LYVSHDFVLQSLSGNGSSSEALKTMRSNSESTQYSYSIGGRFGFTFPSGMGLKTGFNISRVNRGFSYSDTDGMDSMSMTSVINTTNTYTYVDIPVLFSYEMSGFGPFYYNINAGLLFNMTFTPDGQFLSPTGEVVPFTRGAENKFEAYKKEAGAAFFASFGMHYVWNETFDFILEPNFKYSIGSTTISEYPLDEKYTSLGLITGIRYKF